MWPFVKDFLYRGWQEALADGSSTGISVIWLGFCVLTLGFVFTVAIEWLTRGRNMVAQAAALRSWKSWVGAILALFVGWVFLFGYSLFSMAYKDHQELLAAKGKPCPLRTSPLFIPDQKVPKGIQAQTHITQNGNDNTANSGTVTGHVDVKPCGVFQNGGSNNTATTNCAPTDRRLSRTNERASPMLRRACVRSPEQYPLRQPTGTRKLSGSQWIL